MASDIWLRTILTVRKETRCRHIGYSYRLTARVILYEPSHRQDNTYHGLCYTSRGALAGTRNNSLGPPHEGSIHHERTLYLWATSRSLMIKVIHTVVHPFFLISPGKLVLTHVVVITFQLFWRMMDHLQRVQRWKLARANWDEFQHLCSTRLHKSAMNNAEDPMSLFTSILKDKQFLRLRQYQSFSINHGLLTHVKVQWKTETGLSRGSNVNQPRVTWMHIALLGLTFAEISETVRKHLEESMSSRWILKHRLNLYWKGI